MSYMLDISLLLIDIRRHFKDINEDKELPVEDKKQLKDFYLQHMIAPERRKLLEKHFPNGIESHLVHHRMTPADRRRCEAMRSSSPDRHTPDR